MNRSTPGLPVHHQLPEFIQTHVHRVSDAIQPSHPRSSPSPPVPVPLSIRVFSNESTLCMRWPKYWSFSLSISPSKEHPRADLLQNGLVGSPCSPRDSWESSPTPQFKRYLLFLWLVNSLLCYHVKLAALDHRSWPTLDQTSSLLSVTTSSWSHIITGSSFLVFLYSANWWEVLYLLVFVYLTSKFCVSD